MYEKAVHRVQVPNFNPKSTIDIINQERSTDVELSEAEKHQLLQQYLDVSIQTHSYYAYVFLYLKKNQIKFEKKDQISIKILIQF